MSDCAEDTYFDWLRQVTFAQIWDDIRHRLRVPGVDEEAVQGGSALASACVRPHVHNARIIVLGVADTYGLELVPPRREGRSPRQLGDEGLSNWRWIIGAKFEFVLNHLGLCVA